MKKNKGQKSLKKVQKGNENPPRWRDSMRNYKHFCLHCFKTFKHGGSCCSHPTFTMHPDARPPKQREGKAKWKKFFELFLHGSRVDKPIQLKRIIAIRKEYKLPTLEQEKRLEKLTQEREESFSIFDIKRHERVSIRSYYYEDDKNPYTEARKLLAQVVERGRKSIKDMEFKHNTEYFLVPMISGDLDYGELVIPTKSGYFDIYKVRGYTSKEWNVPFEWHIKTGNSKEVVTSLYSDNNRYAHRQALMCFDDRIKAVAFRQEFLSSLYPILKGEGLDYLKDIVKTVNVDYDRVTKKAPELLI